MADPRDAVEFLQAVTDAESDNRVKGEENMRFRYGDQWPQYAIASRGLERPQLTVNELDSYIRQVANNQRQQRPRGKAHPVDSKGDVKLAKVVTGLGRHIEVMSDADHAYDTSFDHALTIGWGYWRLRADYIRPDSFDQDIYIDTILNPFTVYFDYMSELPDGSDAKKALITSLHNRTQFIKDYPGASLNSFNETGTGDDMADWVTQDTVRLAEYYYIERIKSTLIKLSDGTVLWKDQLPSNDILADANIQVIGDRESMKSQVKWQKQSAVEILDKKDIPGLYIPVVPVYGSVAYIDGKRQKFGLVEFAKDPQRMINFWNTVVTESLALSPKAKWVLVEGQDEGHEAEWAGANLSNAPVLRYKQVDVEGKPAPPPQRLQPEPPPAGAIQAMFESSRNLQKVLGIFDPTEKSTGPMSGKSLREEKMQADNSNYHYYDNLTRSIKHTWRIMLGWFPTYYDTERVQRIIGEDGKPELVTINEKKQEMSPENQAITKVLNCVCVGEYDVVMETGPGFDTKRQEGVEAMVQLMGTPVGQQVATVGADILVRQIDAPGMDILADRLEAANPLSKIDDQSDVPPQAQMMIKQLQQQVEQSKKIIMQQGLEIKYRGGIESMKQEAETKRTLMETTAKAHDVEQRNLSMQHSTETKALTEQNTAELDAMTKLMLKGVDTSHLRMEIAMRDKEQKAKLDEDASAGAITHPDYPGFSMQVMGNA